jgi:hypothetical protein
LAPPKNDVKTKTVDAFFDASAASDPFPANGFGGGDNFFASNMVEDLSAGTDNPFVKLPPPSTKKSGKTSRTSKEAGH